MKINREVPLNENHQNSNIEFHILDEKIMNSYGFYHTCYGEWIFCKGLGETISMNIKICDNCVGFIDILDDDFLQVYDFQEYAEKNDFAKSIQKKVYDVMTELTEVGIISGWNVGDYI